MTASHSRKLWALLLLIKKRGSCPISLHAAPKASPDTADRLPGTDQRHTTYILQYGYPSGALGHTEEVVISRQGSCAQGGAPFAHSWVPWLSQLKDKRGTMPTCNCLGDLKGASVCLLGVFDQCCELGRRGIGLWRSGHSFQLVSMNHRAREPVSCHSCLAVHRDRAV